MIDRGANKHQPTRSSDWTTQVHSSWYVGWDVNTDPIQALRCSERHAPLYLARTQADRHERAEGWGCTRRPGRPEKELALEHERRAMHHRVVGPNALTGGLVSTHRLECRTRDKRDDGCDAIRRHDDDIVRWIECDTTPVCAADIGRKYYRTAAARRGEGATVAQLVEALATGVSSFLSRSP